MVLCMNGVEIPFTFVPLTTSEKSKFHPKASQKNKMI